MDAAADGRNLYPLLAPFVRADDTQQLAHRGDIALVCRAVNFHAGLPHVRSPAQRNRVIAFERQQQHSQRARALRLCLAMQMKGFGRRCRRGRGFPSRLAIDAPRKRLQQLPRVLEVAPPQQRRPLACEAVGGIGGRGVVRDDNPIGRRRTALRAPASGAYFAPLFPADARCLGHDTSTRQALLIHPNRRRLDDLRHCAISVRISPR
jgi:hypothetical protein